MTSEGLTLEQKRAQHALNQINAIKDKEYGHYVSYVSAFPANVVMNGLGQALTMLLAKAGRKKTPKEDPHYFLFEHVSSWLSGQIPELTGGVGSGNADPLIQRLMQNDQKVYLRAQSEAMAYTHWLKQFARAYLVEPEGRE